MKIFFGTYPIAGLILAFISCSSNADFPPCNLNLCFQPYLGTDAGIRHITYGGGANKLFKTNIPQAAVYGGLKFSDYVGAEAGYKFSILKSQFVRLDAGDQILGLPLVFPPEYYIAKSQFKGWYGSLLGYFPVCDYPLDILGSVGFIRLQTYHYESILIDQDPLAGPNAATSFLANGRTFKTEKTLLTLGLGAQYVYCNTFGIRLKVDWENTSRIKNIKPLEVPNSQLSLNLNNTIIYNLGIFVPF